MYSASLSGTGSYKPVLFYVGRSNKTNSVCIPTLPSSTYEENTGLGRGITPSSNEEIGGERSTYTEYMYITNIFPSHDLDNMS